MAYTPPPKDTVFVNGGLGNQTGQNSNNGGGATKAAWDAGSPSDFIGATGGPITSDTNAAFDYGNKTITATGIGVGVTVGTLCSCDDGAAEASFFTGIYEVTAVADNVLTFANISLSGVDTDQANGVSCYVGGAFDDLQDSLDNSLNDGTNYNRYIYTNYSRDSGNENTATTVKADTYGGSASTKVYVIGYNSTLTAESSAVLVMDADVTGEAANIDKSLFGFSTVDYLEFRDIDFNAGGKDSSKASFAIYALGAGDGAYTTFVSCKFRGAETDGAYFNAQYARFIGSEFSLNGRYGISSSSGPGHILVCSIHDNDNSGMYITIGIGTVRGNLIYDNGKDGSGHGIESNSCSRNLFDSNNLFGNADDGFQMNGGDYNNAFVNNASIGNGAYGYDFDTLAIGDIGYFGHNLAGANTTDHYYFGGGAGTGFATFANGDNVASSQAAADLFTNVTDGSEDFTPKTGSDLIDAGLDAASMGEQDIGAVQATAGAGGVQVLGGMIVR